MENVTDANVALLIANVTSTIFAGLFAFLNNRTKAQYDSDLKDRDWKIKLLESDNDRSKSTIVRLNERNALIESKIADCEKKHEQCDENFQKVAGNYSTLLDEHNATKEAQAGLMEELQNLKTMLKGKV